MDPLVFEPYLRPQVWGGRRLATRLGKSLPDSGTYGESWELSAHPHHVSRVTGGPLDGVPLDELWRTRRTDLTGGEPRGAKSGDSTAHDAFPLLFKYLDCDQLLSVQVHPTDQLARELGVDQYGKTEAWVVIEAEPNARVYAGLKEGVTRAELERRLEQGTVADCLHSFVPRPGDCVFLPAGTVHAVGGGVLMAEVQQSSDATFRLFDWNRPGPDGKPRTLHIDQALRAIDWTRGPVNPVVNNPLGDPSSHDGERLVSSEYFELTRFTLTSVLEDRGPGPMTVVMLLAGSAVLEDPTSGFSQEFQAGQSVLIPATAGARRFARTSPGPATLLMATAART